MKKATRFERVTHVDGQGEIRHEQTTEVFHLQTEPNYVKLYVDDIGTLYNLSKSQNAILLHLATRIDWDGVVGVSKTRFEKTVEPYVDVSYQTFKNTVAVLVQKGIFYRAGRGELEANPFLFARGDWASIQERRKRIELTIRYDQSGRVVETKVLDDTDETDQ